MRNVYLIQPNYSTGSGEFSNYWLPYSVGCLWAYASQFPDIASRYALAGLYFQRPPIEKVIAGMRDPQVVGFSNYIWNANYNRALAMAIRHHWPRATILFGGPEVPNDPTEFILRDTAVDITVHQEGELKFTQILRACLDDAPDLTKIGGIAYRSGDRVIRQPGPARINALNELPSPYTSGVFEALVAAHPGAKWAATLETNRGCPFKCHFCDWGSVNYSKVKRFTDDRVLRDLDWLADNRVEFVLMADANFGIYKERDNAIADYILEVVDRTGYPKTFNIQWTKNSNSEIVQMARKLSRVQRGLTLSVQSMSEDVLAAVERRNMAINNLAEILDICNREGLPSYTELILGLPEETLESWKSNFHRLLELGQHCAIDVWIAQVLQNSALNDPAERQRYGIETVNAKDYFTVVATDDDVIRESISLVRATRSMSPDDLIDAYMYSWMIVNFHLYGWTQLASRFLHNHASMSYEEFYGQLFAFVRGDGSPTIHREYERTRALIVEYMTTGDISGNLSSEIDIDLKFNGHNLLWLSQMVFRYRGRRVFEEMKPFWNSVVSCAGADIGRDLLIAQEHAVTFYGERFPKEFETQSNIVEVAFNRAALEKRRFRYRADIRKEIRDAVGDAENMALADFLYMMYYKRRSSPGTTAISRVEVASAAHAESSALEPVREQRIASIA